MAALITRGRQPDAVLAAGPVRTVATSLQAVQVADRVWFVQGAAALGTPANRNFISNAGFIVTDDGVVVIDAVGHF